MPVAFTPAAYQLHQGFAASDRRVTTSATERASSNEDFYPFEPKALTAVDRQAADTPLAKADRGQRLCASARPRRAPAHVSRLQAKKTQVPRRPFRDKMKSRCELWGWERAEVSHPHKGGGLARVVRIARLEPISKDVLETYPVGTGRARPIGRQISLVENYTGYSSLGDSGGGIISPGIRER